MSDDRVDWTLARSALQWRVGLAYYSFLREIYTIVGLRSQGIDLRLHPLADALFRVDAWVGRTVLNLWVDNDRYRAQTGRATTGRKRTSAKLLEEADPPFQFHNLHLAAATKFGRVHLPSPTALAEAADGLRNQLAASDGSIRPTGIGRSE